MTTSLAGHGDQQPLVEFATPADVANADAEMWQAWLADPETRRRFETLVYRRGDGRCSYWLGALSSTGHGKFRAGSRPRQSSGPSRIVTAHVFAYQLHFGLLPSARAGQIVVRHVCDETSCQNWEDLVIGTQPDNVRDYQARRGRENGPLADRRGARGRAVAIRTAILTARQAGTNIEDALRQAIDAGIPPRRERLF